MEAVGRLKTTSQLFYKHIFLIGSVLHTGNIIEYFSKHSEKLVVFYLNITVKGKKDFIEVYRKGILREAKQITTPSIPLIYYFFVYFYYIKVLLAHFSNEERFFIITFHPIFFIGNSIVRKVRKCTLVLWVIDYLPNPSFAFKLYQWCMFYYHKQNKYNLYLADGVNRAMNGSVKKSAYQKTVMWGVKNETHIKKLTNKPVLAFIGVIRRGHGLDLTFKVLSRNKRMKFKVLGQCEENLYKEYKTMIKKLRIENQVTFLNKFYSSLELQRELATCTIGIALYTTDTKDAIYYTDPGKVKTYTQFGLPVIMSDTSAIVPFIKRFQVGEVVERKEEAIYNAINKIMKNYNFYEQGVKKFNAYFDYETYYRKAFVFLEKK